MTKQSQESVRLPHPDKSGFAMTPLDKFMSKKLIAKSTDQGQRLDKFLVQNLAGPSRSQIQKMIKAGLILLNDKAVAVHHFLKWGDVVEIKEKNGWEQNFDKIFLNIIFENNDFLVVDKPAGTLVHPTDKGEKNTLINAVLEKYPPIAQVGETGTEFRPGVVHRLDKDASGLMVIAKNQTAYSHLKNQFQSHLVHKEYLALVHGRLEKPAGAINLPIGYSANGGQRAAHPLKGGEKFAEHDRPAITEYEIIRIIKNYTLVKIKIKTGRTHQIRVHFKAIGHPIVGDPIYQIKKFFSWLRKKEKINRPFLHATKLGFYDLNHHWQFFESDLPIELKNYLSELETK